MGYLAAREGLQINARPHRAAELAGQADRLAREAQSLAVQAQVQISERQVIVGGSQLTLLVYGQENGEGLLEVAALLGQVGRQEAAEVKASSLHPPITGRAAAFQ